MRSGVVLAAGALATVGALKLLAGPERSAIEWTLVALPFAAALLAVVGTELRAPSASAAERLLGVAWLALALHEERLGVRWSAEIVAGALVLLLGWRVSRLLPALRRRLDAAVSGGWRWPFAVVPLAVGIALLPWVHAAAPPNGDEPYFLLLAESLVSDRDFDLADEYREVVAAQFTERAIEPQPGDREGRHGDQRSRHESLLVVYLAPFWLAGGAFGCRLGMVVLWALLSERLLALARSAGVPARGALGAWLIATFAPPLAIYAAQLWIEIPAALAIAIALELWARARREPERVDARRELLFCVALLALPLLKLRLLAIALPLALARLAERRHRRVVLAGLAALAALSALVLWRNERIVGRPLGVYAASDFLLFDQSATTYLLRLDGLLFDLGFGLLAAGPIWLFALSGFADRAARRGVAGLALLCSLPYLALVLSLRSWYGGWCPPFRYGIVLLPIATVALGFALAHPPRRAQRLLGWTLGLATAVIGLATVVVPGWATSFADGRSRIVDLVGAPFTADLARLLPSALRPRPATWIVPIVALLLLWLARHDRRRRVRVPELAAAAALLVLFSAALVAAHRLPTRVVEAEDPWLGAGIGALYPDPWAVDRTQFASGRSLGAGGGSLEIRPAVGGVRATIRLVYRAHPDHEAGALLILSSSRAGELHRRALGAGGSWVTETLPERPWVDGETLRIEITPADPGAPGGAVIIDRVEFQWR